MFLHRIEAALESSSYPRGEARRAAPPGHGPGGEILTRLEAEGVKDFAG